MGRTALPPGGVNAIRPSQLPSPVTHAGLPCLPEVEVLTPACFLWESLKGRIGRQLRCGMLKGRGQCRSGLLRAFW